jgi:hypothetical protein
MLHITELKRLTSVANDIDRDAAVHNCEFALSLHRQAQKTGIRHLGEEEI